MAIVFTSERVSDEYLSLNNCGTENFFHKKIVIKREGGRADYLILYIAKGVCRAVIDDEQQLLKEGSLILFRPYEKQSYSFGPEYCSSMFAKQGKGEKMSINFSAQLGLTDFTNEIKPNDLSGFIQRRQDFQRRINPDKPEGYYNNPNQLPESIDVDTWQNYDASYQSDPILTWMTRLNLRDIEQQNYLNGNAYDWYGEATRPGFLQSNENSSFRCRKGTERQQRSAGSR